MSEDVNERRARNAGALELTAARRLSILATYMEIASSWTTVNLAVRA
jgi:hypothetical protein